MAWKGVLAAEFEKVMIESSIGIVSEVFQTQFGFHFLEVLDKRNYDMTRDLIEDRAYQFFMEESMKKSLKILFAL